MRHQTKITNRGRTTRNKTILALAGLLSAAVSTPALAETTNALSQFTVGAYGSSVSLKVEDSTDE